MFIILTRGSTLTERSTHNPKIGGLNPATGSGTLKVVKE